MPLSSPSPSINGSDDGGTSPHHSNKTKRKRERKKKKKKRREEGVEQEEEVASLSRNPPSEEEYSTQHQQLMNESSPEMTASAKKRKKKKRKIRRRHHDDETELKESPLPADNANNNDNDDDVHIGGNGKTYDKDGGIDDDDKEARTTMTAMIMAKAEEDCDDDDRNEKKGEGNPNDNDDDEVEEEEFDDMGIESNDNSTKQSTQLQTSRQKHRSWHKKVRNNLFHDNNKDDDSDEEAAGGGVSVEEIKIRTIGRSIPSIYSPHHTATNDSSHYNNAITTTVSQGASTKSKIAPNNNVTTDVGNVARKLQHELSCPICQDILYNPVSLLCGHNFCFACLDWWLDRAHQQVQEDEDEDRGQQHHVAVLTFTCPTCREIIPTTAGSVVDNDTNNDDDDVNDDGFKPKIRINTVLKTVLMTLYPLEMSLRHQAELQKQKRAISGESGGYHTLGSHVEIVPLLDEGSHELDFIHHSSSSSTFISNDEEYGWKALYPLSSRPGWSSISSTSLSNNRGKGGDGVYTHGSGPRISIRRNIVLDENDQRYQLSLGLTKCTYHPDATASSDTNVSSSSIGDEVATTVGGIIDIELCLLSMEEDEVDDSAGFPIVITDGHDDEALICADEHRVHTCIESIARVVLTTTPPPTSMKENLSSPSMLSIREVPLSRGMIGRDGTVRFRIDMKSALVGCTMSNKIKDDIKGDDDDADSDDKECGEVSNKVTPSNASGGVKQVIKLIFHHVDTGAKLELRLPSASAIHEITRNGNHCSEGIDFCGLKKKQGNDNESGEYNGKNTASRYLLDDPDDDEDDDDSGENEYDLDDGFLVDGSQDSDKSDDTDEFDSDDADKKYEVIDIDDTDDDDNDVDGECQICNKGGDLIVCDGGDHQNGCGNSYHILCIGRTVVPPGDWICMSCSKDVGFDIGIEGHEYANEKIDSISTSKKTKPLVIDDSDDENNDDDDNDDEIASSRTTKRIKRKILHTPDSDSE